MITFVIALIIGIVIGMLIGANNTNKVKTAADFAEAKASAEIEKLKAQVYNRK